MIILAVNCAGKFTNAAAAIDGRVLSEFNEELGRKQTEQLPLIAQRLLEENSLSFCDINYIAAGIGPGYYTGIRAGIAYAAGLAEALNIKVIPISSLELFAWDLKDKYKKTAVFFKANMTHVYGAVFESCGGGLRALLPQRFIAEEDFAGLLARHPDAALISPDFAKYNKLSALANIKIEKPSASGGSCAIMGFHYLNKALLPSEIRGEYLREPDIGPSLN